MSTRFEILKNGERVCISGINGDGILDVSLIYVKHAGKDPSHDLRIGGLGMFDGSHDCPHHARWSAATVVTGDEITIRILPGGEYDEPHGMTSSPKKTVDDPDFGQMDFYINSWDADIAFESDPIATAHIHIRADESGLSQMQRDLLLEFPDRHTQLWSELCDALVRCHPEIETTNKLTERIVPHIGIDLTNDSNRIGLKYRVEGDPEFRGYRVTLRNWEIVEVGMVE